MAALGRLARGLVSSGCVWRLREVLLAGQVHLGIDPLYYGKIQPCKEDEESDSQMSPSQ